MVLGQDYRGVNDIYRTSVVLGQDYRGLYSISYKILRLRQPRLEAILCPPQALSSKDLRFCRLRGRFSILRIGLVQLLPWLRFQVLHVDADKNWA